MSFTATDVKTLREKTNAGMMDCKKALEQAKGNMDQAVEILRKRGLAVAQSKAGRTAAEGILGHYLEPAGKAGLLVEVNCETDFVVKTDDFQKFVAHVTERVKAEKPKDLETLLGHVKEDLTALIGKIGENIQVRRFEHWIARPEKEVVGLYLHAGSKIGVLVVISDPEGKVTTDAAKEIAMHVAAMHPGYVRREEVPAEVLDKEREIQRATVDTKKPPEIQNKIIEGKLNKFFGDCCLEEQIFVKDLEGKKTVRDWLKAISPTARIERFVRLQVGA
ncbi:MAG: translation elongation factor Ts [Deltaproteobacteria bacterium]|nr:translation elongation factor Ts [Deltaproteobacteria bacterium]